MVKTDQKILPLEIKCKDKIDLAFKLLRIYSQLVEPLTDRNISLLAMIMIEDVNDDNFFEIVKRSNIGIHNEGQFRVEMHRLKEKKLIYKDTIVKRKDLSPRLQKIANIVNNENDVGLFLNFRF